MNWSFDRSLRIVMADARGRCGNPWCSRPPSDAHHIVHRHEDGGDNPENLISLCKQCHAAYHAGLLGRRSIQGWKNLIGRGDAAAIGTRLDGWRSLNRVEKQRLWRHLRLGRLGGLMEICSGRYDPAFDSGAQCLVTLHAFIKKTRRTVKFDLDLAKSRKSEFILKGG